VSLRGRATIGFGLVGLVVSAVLAIVTYQLARSYLLDQRQQSSADQAFANARLARTVLRAEDPDVAGFLTALGGDTASTSVIRYREEWYATSLAARPDDLPDDLLRLAGEGRAGRQRDLDDLGRAQLAVAVPIAATDALYVELFSLAELQGTLDLLARALGIGTVAATATAALVGRLLAGRLVRPLRPVADAAERIAGGALDTRLETSEDPDLDRLVGSFNSMAAALEERIEREARFAADVSHELRAPLAAMAAAIEVISRRQGDMPKDVVGAFEVLADKVGTFQHMVLDLLEISRIDAGTAELQPDAIDLPRFLSSLVEAHESNASVEFTPGTPTHIRADRRRLAQVIGNLVDNAAQYAGGLVSVEVDAPTDETIQMAFEDRGPGIAAHERETIFGRFARGEVGVRQGAASGTGLGLALVAEHVRLHGGSIWVEDGAAGGARFVVELPLVVP
jgi:signal transduction histidine kinase